MAGLSPPPLTLRSIRLIISGLRKLGIPKGSQDAFYHGHGYFTRDTEELIIWPLLPRNGVQRRPFLFFLFLSCQAGCYA